MWFSPAVQPDGGGDIVRLVPARDGLRLRPRRASDADVRVEREAVLRVPADRPAAWGRRVMDGQRLCVAAARCSARVRRAAGLQACHRGVPWPVCSIGLAHGRADQPCPW